MAISIIVGAGASVGYLSCFGKKDTKEADLRKALRNCSRNYMRPSLRIHPAALDRKWSKCFGAVFSVFLQHFLQKKKARYHLCDDTGRRRAGTIGDAVSANWLPVLTGKQKPQVAACGSCLKKRGKEK